jgi:hypothetical protein
MVEFGQAVAATFNVTVIPVPLAATGDVVIVTGVAPCRAAIKLAVEIPAAGRRYCGVCTRVKVPPGDATVFP